MYTETYTHTHTHTYAHADTTDTYATAVHARENGDNEEGMLRLVESSVKALNFEERKRQSVPIFAINERQRYRPDATV